MSILHLCKITDKHSNSQWPLWIPKTDCVEKNIIEIYEDIWKLELKLYIFSIQLINKGTLKKCIDIIQYKIH